MSLERRVRALETRYIREPVILTLPDGTTAELRGHGDFLLRLFADFCAGAELRPEQVAQLDLIRRSSGARRGAHDGGASMRPGRTSGDKRQCVGRRLRFVALRAGPSGRSSPIAGPSAPARLAADLT
jgi:hypothetical protein